MKQKKDNRVIAQKQRITDILEMGIDAVEYERILGMEAVTGGQDNILFECSETQALILAVMEAIFYPRTPDGQVDDIISYDDPVGLSFITMLKYNMKSNKRKGLMETVKVLVGKPEDDEGMVGKVKQAIRGED